MKLVLTLSLNIIFFILVKNCLDSYLIALFCFALTCIFIGFKNIDYQFVMFIKKAQKHRELIELMKDKKYRFSDKNTVLLKNYLKLVTNNDNFKRFVTIQKQKNDTIIKNLNIESYFYFIFTLLALIPLVILDMIRRNNVYYYYYLYSNKYMVALAIVCVTLINIIHNLRLLNKTSLVDEELFNNYSLCFHLNCAKILNINDNRLTFGQNGFINELDLKQKYKFNYRYLFTFATIIIGIIGVIIFI